MTTKDEVHIEFVVTSSDGRHVTFKGDAPIIGIRDWFERAALGLSFVFEPMGPSSLRCTNGGNNKIQSIKKVREVTNLGLLEAKNFIEGSHNIKMDPINSKILIAELRVLGCTVMGTAGSSKDILVGSVPATPTPGATANVEVHVSIDQIIADKVREALTAPR